ncbi:MAG: MFS transporter [Thermoplasmatota archaeon]
MGTEPSAQPVDSPSLREFGFPFWLINTIEMLERAAFYGAQAVLAYYLVTTLGMSYTLAGVIFSVFLPLLYLVPIISSPFSEKIGYRNSLIIAFSLYPVGYGLLAYYQDFAHLLGAAFLIGIAGGIFKPVSAAVVGQSSTPVQRNLAFQVYYWAINIGSFLTPLLIGIYIPEGLYRYALVLSAICCATALLVVLFAFRNIRPPDASKSVLQSLKSLADLGQNPRLLVLLIIYTGFWVMYGINLSFLNEYMKDYVAAPAWFSVALLSTVNPATIIAMGPVITKFTGRISSLYLIVGGLFVYIVGILVLGATSNFYIFLAGVVIYSVAEFMISPAFYSYISKLAPPDRVSIYMAYSFLPIGVGFLISGYGTGVLLDVVVKGMGRPLLFWAIMASVGLLTTASLILYNWWIARADRRVARAQQEGVIVAAPPDVGAGLVPASGASASVSAAGVAAEPSPPPVARRPGRFLGGPVLAAVALLLIPALVGGATLAGPVVSPAPALPQGYQVVHMPRVTGTGQQGQTTSNSVVIPTTGASNATFVLNWTDPQPPGAGLTPGSDEMQFTVKGPGGTTQTVQGHNTGGEPGSMTIVADPGSAGASGSYNVSVELVQAGGYQGPLGVQVAQATTNAWTLDVSYLSPTNTTT